MESDYLAQLSWNTCPPYFLISVDLMTPFDLRRCNLVCKSWNGCFSKKYSNEILSWIVTFIGIRSKNIPTLVDTKYNLEDFPLELILSHPIKLKRRGNIDEIFRPNMTDNTIQLFEFSKYQDIPTTLSQLLKNMEQNTFDHGYNLDPNLDPFLFIEYISNFPKSSRKNHSKAILIKSYFQKSIFHKINNNNYQYKKPNHQWGKPL